MGTFLFVIGLLVGIGSSSIRFKSTPMKINVINDLLYVYYNNDTYVVKVEDRSKYGNRAGGS